MIAITGGIAEGKSTVLQMLADSGYRTVSADGIAREVFQTPWAQARMAEIFGVQSPSRETIREMISEKPGLRRALNQVMHGPIWKGILESGAQFVEIPLLVETCLHPRFRVVWMVTCGFDEQLRRLSERLGGEPAAVQMMSTQLSSRAKAQFADRIVRTNAELNSVLGFVQSAAKIDVAR